ncbi:Acyl-CoA dehydrogenase OS=Streptomyces fumanus OX=67302 GN=GCM10018772_40220 PE=3 SV=1 [Streptomyces fumanus]
MQQLAVPVAKYWVTKRCPPVAVEAAECLGGNGYVEESGLPRLVRESPLNSIWEGAGNVQALDVLRALGREPAALGREYLTEVATTSRPKADAASGALTAPRRPGRRRTVGGLTERLALVLQGSLLVRYAPPEVADAFCAGRLGGDAGAAFGTLPATLDLASVVERALPVA